MASSREECRAIDHGYGYHARAADGAHTMPYPLAVVQ